MIDQPGKQARPTIGLMEWFRPGEHARVERVLADIQRLNITHLRTGFSWADYVTEAGEKWYDWLMPRLSRDVDVLPCFTYTPPSLGIEPRTSSPPRNPKDFADFLDSMITRYGDHFEWVELWNEPTHLNGWDCRLDPQWAVFREMIAGAANWCRERGKKTVLGGMCPTDPDWLDLLAGTGALALFDAVGIHGFPGTWEFNWTDWSRQIAGVRRVLQRRDLSAEIWITEAGYSTTRNDEFAQLEAFVDLVGAPAARAYWYSAGDLHPAVPHQDGPQQDERHYHFGLYRADGRPKLLSRIWSEEGIDAVLDVAELGRRHAAGLRRATHVHPAGRLNGSSNGHAPGALSSMTRSAPSSNGSAKRQRYSLVTGGAGFIGTNLVVRLLDEGRSVRIFDNLSRPGVERNLEWLCRTYGSRVEVQLEDIRNPWALREAVQRADQVFHFAAQVAVTSSVDHPQEDFEINARGTLNVLEALRMLDDPPPLLFTSTNKVYGALDDVRLGVNAAAYHPLDERFARGIGADRALDFESPYGCSKGAADEYVLDYCRVYGLPTVVFRMSCIYGPHQFGTEDQGWIAHFLMRALRDEPITIYGDGRQVRDILYVDDLTRGMVAAMNDVEAVRGRAFNVGGGPQRAVSLLQVLDLIGSLHGRLPDVTFDEWRPSDQKFYVSDTSALRSAVGWTPNVSVEEGIRRLYEWMADESPVLLPAAAPL